MQRSLGGQNRRRVLAGELFLLVLCAGLLSQLCELQLQMAANPRTYRSADRSVYFVTPYLGTRAARRVSHVLRVEQGSNIKQTMYRK